MQDEDGFTGLPQRVVAAIPNRFLSPARKELLGEWLERTFPSTRDGSSRLFITLTAIVSLLVTFAVHALAYPLHLAGGISLMWLIHEVGHIVAARTLGLAVHAIWFLPFIGVIMLMASGALAREQRKEAMYGISGPLAGFFGTAGAFALFLAIREQIPVFVAKEVALILLVSAFYNVFQLLLTVRPFDGGRVTQIIHPAFRLWALALVLAITALWPKSWLMVVWALVLTDLRFFRQWRRFWLTVLLFVFLLAGILCGHGRARWWWNGADIALVLAVVYWAYGQAKRDPSGWRKLPEWQAFVAFGKYLFGAWRTRGDDRRIGNERRQETRGEDRRRRDRRLRARPIDLRHEGGEFIDRRLRHHASFVGRGEKLCWLAVYLATLGAHLGLGWAVYQTYVRSL